MVIDNVQQLSIRVGYDVVGTLALNVMLNAIIKSNTFVATSTLSFKSKI